MFAVLVVKRMVCRRYKLF